MFGLVCESIGQLDLGIEAIERAIAILEAAYEESEDPVVERRFTIAHINVGRLRLSANDYDGALGSFQVAIGLLPEDAPDQTTQSLLAQAQLCSGLVSFKLGHLEEALHFCQSAVDNAMQDATIRQHAVVVLAQTLWAIGTEEAKESAKAQLLQRCVFLFMFIWRYFLLQLNFCSSIESDADNLLAINALAGMGILTDDDSLVDAALSEILSVSIQERQERDPEGDVTYLLIQHHLSQVGEIFSNSSKPTSNLRHVQGEVAQAISFAQKAVVAHPSQSRHKRQLSTLALQCGETSSAQAVLASSLFTEEDLVETRDSAALQAIAESQSGAESDRALRIAQRAVMMAPWKEFNWRALAHVRTHMTEV